MCGGCKETSRPEGRRLVRLGGGNGAPTSLPGQMGGAGPQLRPTSCYPIPMTTPHVLSIQTGQIRVYPASTDGKYESWASAIDKQTVTGPIRLTSLGLVGDEQEYEDHGGPDKAVLLYGSENYRLWRQDLDRDDIGPGGFGENFTVSTLLESTVCIGDVYHVGEALIEVSQPRIPCYKLGNRWNLPTLTKLAEKSGRTGWYARVLREGEVIPGPLELVERPYPTWTINRIREIRTHRHRLPDEVSALAACSELAVSWKRGLHIPDD